MKCPPGILCITPSLILFIIIITTGIVVFLYMNMHMNMRMDMQKNIASDHSDKTENPTQTTPTLITIVPPLHNQVPPSPERIYDTGTVRTEIPMTIATSGGPSQYQQVGVMRKDGEEEDTLLPLFGRKLQQNRDRWNYYTAGIAGTLPVRVQNRECMDKYTGCNELYDGDTVTVDGLNNGVFKVMMYTVSAPIY